MEEKKSPSKAKHAPVTSKLSTSGRPEVDFKKEWGNGHKAFNSAQVRALDELINTEMGIRDRYEVLKGQIKRPRNPLVGEETPRDRVGNVVMDPGKFHTVQNGVPLFSAEQLNGTLTVRPSPKKKELVGKIGVADEKFESLGNTGSPSRTDNMFDTVAYIHEKKQKLREEQQQVSQYIAREKAKRYQHQLQREIAALHKTAEAKQEEMSLLRTKYGV